MNRFLLTLLRQAGKFLAGLKRITSLCFLQANLLKKYLNIDGYGLLNARVGFRASDGLSASLWARNLLDKEYYEQLLVAGGNAGHYAGVLGDLRTYGITVRYTY